MCGLNAQEALGHLLLIFENQSSVGSYYREYVSWKVDTLENAFEMKFNW